MENKTEPTQRKLARWRRPEPTQRNLATSLPVAQGLSEPPTSAFFFFILKKIKISKIYVHFEKFQKYPRSPPHWATGPKCNFISLNSQRGPWQKKKACRPPQGRQGPVACWAGDRVPFALYKPWPPYAAIPFVI